MTDLWSTTPKRLRFAAFWLQVWWYRWFWLLFSLRYCITGSETRRLMIFYNCDQVSLISGDSQFCWLSFNATATIVCGMLISMKPNGVSDDLCLGMQLRRSMMVLWPCHCNRCDWLPRNDFSDWLLYCYEGNWLIQRQHLWFSLRVSTITPGL